MKTNLYIIFFLSLSFSLFAQPEMIYDKFNTRSSTRIYHQMPFNDKFVFMYEQDQKRDIWMLDDGTLLNLTANLSNNDFSSPIVVGNELYFHESNGEFGINLWKTDGTITGTELIWENMKSITQKSILNDKLVMGQRNENGSNELWLIDGINRTKFFESSEYVFQFTNFQDQLYFFIRNIGLMKTDGTLAGTVLVKPYDSNTFTDGRFYSTVIKDGELYFTGCDDIHGCEVWKTDGTENGTIFLNDLVNVTDNSTQNVSSHPRFISLDNAIYAYNSYAIFLLENNSFTNLIDLEYFNKKGEILTGQVINNHLLFIIETPEDGREIWKVNTITNELELLKSIKKGGASGLNSWSFNFEEHDGFLYFRGNDGVFGNELWRTDGTTAGTKIVYDLMPRGASSFINNAFSYNDKLYFTNVKYDESWNPILELWKFDLSNYTPPNYPDYRDNEDWFSSASSGYFNEYADYELDADENSYLLSYEVGGYGRSFQFFDQDTSIAIEAGKYGNLVLAKLSKDATFTWAVQIHTYETFYDDDYRIAIDKDKNVFVTGIFSHQLEIQGQTFSGEDESFFLAKFSENGTLLWVKVGFTEYLDLRDIKVNDNGEIFISGFGERFLYQNMNLSKTSEHAFLIKLDKDGAFQWLHQYRSDNVLSHIKFTDDGNTLLVTSNANIDVRKINQNGENIWLKRFPTNRRTDVNGVEINNLGEIFIVGGYKNTLRIGQFEKTYIGDKWDDQNGFVLILNSVGKEMALFADEKSTHRYEDIQIDAENNYFLLGTKRTETYFSYENWERYQSDRWTTVQKFDKNGQLLKERNILKFRVNFDDNPHLRLGKNERIYMSDLYSDQLDTFSNTIQRSIYQEVAYILSFSMTAENSEIFEVNYPDIDFTLFPNPTTDFVHLEIHNENWQNYRLTIYNTNGQLLRTIEKNDRFNFYSMQTAGLPKGILIFHFDNGTEKVVRKVLKN